MSRYCPYLGKLEAGGLVDCCVLLDCILPQAPVCPSLYVLSVMRWTSTLNSYSHSHAQAHSGRQPQADGSKLQAQNKPSLTELFLLDSLL